MTNWHLRLRRFSLQSASAKLDLVELKFVLSNSRWLRGIVRLSNELDLLLVQLVLISLNLNAVELKFALSTQNGFVKLLG